MKISDFRNCIRYVFGKNTNINDIYKVDNNIYIVYYNNKVFIKSKFDILKKSKLDNYIYTYICNNPEEFINCLIEIKKYTTKNNVDISVNDILYKLSNTKFEDELKNKLIDNISNFDELINPFSDNKEFISRITDLLGTNEISFNFTYNNSKNYNYNVSLNNNTQHLGFKCENELYISNFSKVFDKSNKVYLEHMVIPNQKDDIILYAKISNIDLKFIIDLLHDKISTIKNNKIDLLPIHVEIINEDIENIVNELKNNKNIVKIKKI